MTAPNTPPATSQQNTSREVMRIGIVEVVRFVCELFALVSFVVWGFTAWALPLNVVVGILTPVLAIVLWALFCSPRAVFSTDLYVRALIELVIMITAAFCWWNMHQLLVGGIFALIAVIQGVITHRRELAS